MVPGTGCTRTCSRPGRVLDIQEGDSISRWDGKEGAEDKVPGRLVVLP